MSSKESKPSLAGASIKTRKRNIAVPLDPGSFADAVVQVFEDTKEGDNLEKNLEAAAKTLDSAELDFKRYGETFFEVFFAGARMSSGGNVADGKKLSAYVMACSTNRDEIIPFIKFFQAQIRRKPFLIKSLEATLVKLIMSLEFFEDDVRKRIAIAMARVFAMKVGVLPDHVLVSLLTDRLVAKGTILQFVTEFFRDFLATESMDDLVQLLRKGKLEGRLLDLFPPQKRTEQGFSEHFEAEGITELVDYNKKKTAEKRLQELKTELINMIQNDPPATATECVTMVAAKRKEAELPDVEVVKVVWAALAESLALGGKNQQQIGMSILKQTTQYAKLLEAVCTSGRLELQLLVTIQVFCYEDSRMLRLFKDIIRVLYDNDVIAEDTVKYWYSKGSHPKGRNVFLKDIEPFIKWLDEAEEEEEDDD